MYDVKYIAQSAGVGMLFIQCYFVQYWEYRHETLDSISTDQIKLWLENCQIKLIVQYICSLVFSSGTILYSVEYSENRFQ
jgi:hypothetical protein